MNDDNNKKIEESVKCILENLGDPNFERIESDTPRRAAKAYGEFFSGYDETIGCEAKNNIQLTNAIFDSTMDDMVILKNIPFESYCEHHVVPIIGVASVAYIPDGKIIGASKLARIVDCFAHRLQLQERFTMEIANTINTILHPRGVAVYVQAEHFCISHRGVKKQGTKLVTQYFIGNLKDNYNLRQEFLSNVL